MDPTQVAGQISAGGWPYLFAASVIIGGGVITYLGKALLSAKDSATKREQEFAAQMLMLVGQHKDALDEIKDALSLLRERLGGQR